MGRAKASSPVIAAAVAVLAPLALVLLILASRGRVPDPLPTHWTALDRPDGFTRQSTYNAILVGIAGIGAFAAVVTARVRRLSGVARRASVAVASTVAWCAVGVWAIAPAAAWGATEADSVALQPWLFLLLLAAPLGGVASYVTYGSATSPPLAPLVGAEVPIADLGPDERVAWSQRISEPVLYLVAVLLLGVAAFIVAVGAPWGVVIPVVAGAAGTAALASARVAVDDRGLLVSIGPFGSVGKRITPDRIVRVSVVTIRPMEWGGWGYRLMPGRSAVVLRRGPGLVVDLTDGRRFAVTVDDPRTPASLLNALRPTART